MKKAIRPWLPPFVGLALVGLYSAVNLGSEVLVQRLGCGCVRGFNTNHLTLLVGIAAMVIVFAGSIMASRSIRPGLRSGYIASASGAFTVIVVAFLALNAWA